jgi:hypothetical protein
MANRTSGHGFDHFTQRTSRRTVLKASGVTAAATLLTTLGWRWADIAEAQAIQRPISDFVNAQGTAPPVFTAPEGDNLGWSTPQSAIPITLALVDYAGVWARWLHSRGITLGTATTGTIAERALPDGRAEVSIVLRTTRALTWVIRSNDASLVNTPKSPLVTRLFGYSAEEIATSPGLTPGLADSELRLTLTNTAPGAPLPNLVGVNYNPPTFNILDMKQIMFDANATGPLRAAAGLGPDGTPGRCIVGQTGLVAAALRANFRGALGDAFPREIVELRRL